MKALLRNTGETVRETDGIEGIDWETGAPLTNENWCGGSYTIVSDYRDPDSATENPGENPVSVPEPETEKTYTIDGKEYTKSEILKLLD